MSTSAISKLFAQWFYMNYVECKFFYQEVSCLGKCLFYMNYVECKSAYQLQHDTHQHCFI